MTQADDENTPKDLQGDPQAPSESTRKWLNTMLTPAEPIPMQSSDPIARNPKDTGKPGEMVQPAEVHRRTITAAPATGVALGSPDQVWGRGQPAASPSGTDLLVSILRFKWTILIVWILVSAPIIAAVWTQIVPQYQARAEIRVRPIIPRLVFKTDENGQTPFYESYVNTQVSVIRSQMVLQRVLDQKEVQATQWYKNRAKTLLQRLREDTTPPEERLKDSLSVRPRPRTEIIDLSFSAESAAEARVILAAVVDKYMQYVGEQSNAEEDNMDRHLTEQYNLLQSQIQGGEKTCADLSTQLGTDTPQTLVAAKRVRLDAMEARLNELRYRIKVLTADVNQISVADSNGVPVAPPAPAAQKPKYYEDAEWRKLNIDVKRLERQIADSVYLPTHPMGKRMQKDLDFAKGLLKERETQLDELWDDHIRSVAVTSFMGADVNGVTSRKESLPPERELVQAQYEEKLLTTEYETQQAQFKEMFERAQLLEREARDLRQKRELFDAVRQRKEQKDIERNVPGRITIGAPAFTPSRPEKDRRVVFAAMGLFAGLGLGGGLAFLRAMRNQTIYAVKDMPQPAQTPFLGYVPLVNLRKPLGRALCEEIEQKQGHLTESLRVLRTALLSRLSGQGRTTVVVTSANAGTGKSSFTAALGKSIAQAGRRVLLIDADLHKTGLSKRMKVTDEPGLRESLKDKTPEGLHVFSTETAGLDIMPAGQQNNGDIVFEEFANGAFKNWLQRLFEQYGYDIILLDCPPILPVADAAILAGQVDATILVEREHVSRRTEVASALIRLASSGGHLIGTVFVGSGEHDHYGYGYSYRRYGGKTHES